LGKIVREDCYFTEPGPENLEDVVDAVEKRVNLTGIRYVVVASHSGKTALVFAERLKGKAKVVCVSGRPSRRDRGREWPAISSENRRRLEELGVVVLDRVPYAFESTVLWENRWNALSADRVVVETLYMFGSGMKVAVQVVLTAVSSGYVEPYEDVIGVGGTGGGADTAIVMKASYAIRMFSESPEHRPEIREIIAMPLKKRRD
jgi:hypothetical protein